MIVSTNIDDNINNHNITIIITIMIFVFKPWIIIIILLIDCSTNIDDNNHT